MIESKGNVIGTWLKADNVTPRVGYAVLTIPPEVYTLLSQADADIKGTDNILSFRLDSTGSIVGVVPATDDPEYPIVNWAYKVDLQFVGQPHDSFYVQVPMAGDTDLSAPVTVPPPPPGGYVPDYVTYDELPPGSTITTDGYVRPTNRPDIVVIFTSENNPISVMLDGDIWLRP